MNSTGLLKNNRTLDFQPQARNNSEFGAAEAGLTKKRSAGSIANIMNQKPEAIKKSTDNSEKYWRDHLGACWEQQVPYDIIDNAYGYGVPLTFEDANDIMMKALYVADRACRQQGNPLKEGVEYNPKAYFKECCRYKTMEKVRDFKNNHAVPIEEGSPTEGFRPKFDSTKIDDNKTENNKKAKPKYKRREESYDPDGIHAEPETSGDLSLDLDRGSVLNGCFGLLSPEDKLIVKLKWEKGLQQTEIAEIIGHGNAYVSNAIARLRMAFWAFNAITGSFSYD